MNDDTYEYVPLDERPEGQKTFTFKVTIEPEGAPRVELVGQDAKPPNGRTQS